jgi:ribose transport system ATP-binding protein
MIPIVSLKSVCKSFPGVKAVDNVSLDVNRGEVLALLGENGAGKSTLMKIICGVFPSDQGEIYLDGRRAHFTSPSAAVKSGINVVYQELSLVGTLSVAENIYMTDPPVCFAGRVDWEALNRKTAELLGGFGWDLDPKTLVKRLSMGKSRWWKS